VKNGTVAEVYNCVPNNSIVYQQESLSFETLAGNYVIIDPGNKKYAYYGHFIPKSIRVKVSDAVTEGEVIGLVGNSGNREIPAESGTRTLVWELKKIPGHFFVRIFSLF